MNGQSKSQQLLDGLLAELLQRIEKGDGDVETFVKRYPDHEEELRDFCEMHTAACQLHWSTDHERGNHSSPRQVRCEPTVTNLRHYEIVDEVGRGGMGIVFKARDRRLDRWVAIKVLRGVGASAREFRELEREAKAAGKLDHPGIVPVYEVDCDGDQAFYVMQYVEGHNLRKQVSDGPLANREAAQLMISVARAMQYAHASKVLHCDLKPENILLGSDGAPRVTDFGLAREVASGRTLEAEDNGVIRGTIAYMSPEQAEGRNGGLGPSTDIYSLGAVLYCLVTSSPPFAAATVAATVHQVISCEPAPPRQRNNQVDRDLENICLKCLEKEPRKRYATAQELAEDLQRYLDGRVTVARPVGPALRLLRWCRRKPLVALTLATTFIVLLVALVLVNGSRARVTSALEERRQAVTLLQHSLVRETEVRRSSLHRLAYAQVATADALRTAQNLHDAGVAYHEARNTLETLGADTFLPDVGLSSLRGHAPAPLGEFAGPQGSPHSIRITPDGATALVATFADEFQAYDLATGRMLRSYAGHKGPIRALDLSPDGRWALSGGHDHTVRLWEVASGKLIHTFRGHTSPVSSVAFAPDGAWAISGSAVPSSNSGLEFRQTAKVANRPCSVHVWDLASKREVAELKGHVDRIDCLAISPDRKHAASGSYDRTVRVWNVGDQSLAHRLTGHSGPIRHLAFAPDGGALLTVGADWTAKLWHLESGRVMLSRNLDPVSRGRLESLSAVDSGDTIRRVLLAGSSRNVRFMDVVNQRQLLTFSGHPGQVHGVGLSTTGVAVTASEGRLFTWPATQDRVLRPFVESTQGTRCWSVSRDGSFGVSAGDDMRLRTWDLASGRALAPLPQSSGPDVECLAMSPHGAWLAVAKKNQLQIWGMRDGHLHSTWDAHEQMISKALFCGEERLATASNDGSVRIWGFSGGRWRQESEFKEHRGCVVGLAVSPDGRQLASRAQETIVWGIDDRKIVARCAPPLEVGKTATSRQSPARQGPSFRLFDLADTSPKLNLIAFSSDGNWLVIGDGQPLMNQSQVKRVRVLNIRKGIAKTMEFRGSTAESILAVAFSPDDRLISVLTTSAVGCELRVLERETGLILHTSTLRIPQLSSAHLYDSGRKLLVRSQGGESALIDLGFASALLSRRNEVQAARQTLQEDAQDAEALRTLGRWYAFRGRWDWAISLLTPAAGNDAFEPALLARCHWTRGGPGDDAAARRWFELALKRGDGNVKSIQRILAALPEPPPGLCQVVAPPEGVGKRLLKGDRVFVTSDDDWAIRWEVRAGKLHRSGRLELGPFRVLALRGDDQQLLLGDDQGRLQLCGLAKRPFQFQHMPKYGLAGVRAAAFSSGGSSWIVGGNGGAVSQFHLGMRRPPLESLPVDSEVLGAMGEADPVLAALLAQMTDTPPNVDVLQTPRPRADEVALHPQGGAAAVAMSFEGIPRYPGYLQTWDLKAGKRRGGAVAHTGAITSLQYIHNGDLLLTSGFDGYVRLWRSHAGLEQVQQFDHTAPVLDADVSPDGRHLVSVGVDNLIRVWSVEDGSLIDTLRGHKAAVHGVCVTQDGFFATAGRDGQLRLWKLP